MRRTRRLILLLIGLDFRRGWIYLLRSKNHSGAQRAEQTRGFAGYREFARERLEPIPSAATDCRSSRSMPRITGWIPAAPRSTSRGSPCVCLAKTPRNTTR